MTPNESHTRKEIIDKKLLSAGWDVENPLWVIKEFIVEPSNNNALNEPSSTYNTFSDYVLLGKDGKPLAVIEAKRSSKDAAIGREQAKQYCQQIKSTKGGELPFCFYTNGHDIFYWDIENYPPHKVIGFPTRDDLERLQNIRKRRRKLSDELINTNIAGRDYQIKAIRSVMEGIELRKRHFLLVMATGTGKTRTCIALVDTLIRAGWIEKALFLVDRIALRDQALDDFKEYLPNEPRYPKKDEKEIPTDRRIYVSTYPTMLNAIRSEDALSPHFFDLIIIDESHRSIYNTYQEVLKYFNTIVLGLTATPTDSIDHNTFQLFDCEDGLPTFAFSYEEALKNIPPYLCNFQVMKIHTKFQDDGINKRTISLEDQRKLILEGKEIAEINYEGTDIEKRVINRGTNVAIVKEFMEESIKDKDGVLPGKTIFFCLSKTHARRIEEIFNTLYPQHYGELAKVIISEDPKVHGKGGLIDQFKSNDFPRIAISIDMLDTGIDIRELVNLVFAKPVYSYTKFWQMIGRGTRLLDAKKKKAWCTEKDVFLIMDCWDNFEYFKLNPTGKSLKPQIPLPIRLFEIRLSKIEKAIELSENEILQKESNLLRNLIEKLPKKSITIQEAQQELLLIENDDFWQHLSQNKIDFLRNSIKPLLRTLSDIDFKAMRFEKDVLEVSLAKLSQDDKRFAILSEGLIEQIKELPLSVNIVAKEKELIHQATRKHFYQVATDNDFDILIEKLSPLMSQREGSKPLIIPKFDFKDTITTKEWVEFGPQHESVSTTRYRELVEERIQALAASNLLLQKIKNGSELTEFEQQELVIMLQNERPHITLDLLRKTYQNRKATFQHFIKHILQIEVLETFQESIVKAFQEFILLHNTLTVRQIEFLGILQTYLLEKGNVQKKDLIQAPFTKLHREGIRGLFSPREIEEIISLTNQLVA